MVHTPFLDPWTVILLNTQERREQFTREGFLSRVPEAHLPKEGDRRKEVNTPGLFNRHRQMVFPKVCTHSALMSHGQSACSTASSAASAASEGFLGPWAALRSWHLHSVCSHSFAHRGEGTRFHKLVSCLFLLTSDPSYPVSTELQKASGFFLQSCVSSLRVELG